MTYEDQVLAMFGEANPVSDLDKLEAFLAPRLEIVEQRTGDMTETKVRETNPNRPILPRRRHGWMYGLAAAVFALIFVGVIWALQSNDSEPDVAPQPGPTPTTIVDPTPTTVPESSEPPVELPAGVAASVIGLASPGIQPYDVAIDGDGFPWVTMIGRPVLAKLDPATGETLATYPVSNSPTGLAFLDGSLWIARHGIVGCREIPCPRDPNDNTLDRIDPATGELLAQIELVVSEVDRFGVEIASFTWDIETADGSIWLSLRHGGNVVRVDPATNEIVAEIPTGGELLSGLAATSGTMWVASERDSTVIGIDMATNEVSTVIQLPRPNVPTGLESTESALWVSTFDEKVFRIDPATSEVSDPIDLNDRLQSLAVAFDYVWAPGYQDGILTRIDPATNDTTEIQVVPGIHVVEEVGNQLWVVDGSGTNIYFIDPAKVE